MPSRPPTSFGLSVPSGALLAWIRSSASMLLLLGGCSSTADPGPFVIETDSAGIVIVQNDVLGVSAVCPVASKPDLVIGSAVAGEEYELYRVYGASRLSDGRIALVNQGSQQLRIYDAQGRFLLSAGREGHGPGEFTNAYYLWILPGDTLWVGDFSPWQFHIFSPRGEYVRTQRPSPGFATPFSIGVLDSGRFLLGGLVLGRDAIGNEARSFSVTLYDDTGELVDTIGTYPFGRWRTVDNNPRLLQSRRFESFIHVDAAGRIIAVGHGSGSAIRILDASSAVRLTRIVRWETEPRSITPEDIAADRQRIAEQYAGAPAAEMDVLRAMNSVDRPVAEAFPAFVRLMLGRSGRIWVQEFERPREPVSTQSWLAFDSAGHFVCHADVPDVELVFEFGDDYLLALDRDDLDAERVVMYSIGAPTPRDR